MTTIPQIFDELKTKVAQAKLSADWYVLPQYDGFAALTGETAADVYCIEMDIGQVPQHPDWHVYGLAQLFSRRYPNLCLTTLAVLDQKTGAPQDHPVVFGLVNDWTFSTVMMPLLQRAFNVLDPQGRGRSQLVERYSNSKLPLVNFIPTTFYSFKLVLLRPRSGQYATIAADYDDPLINVVARMITPLSRWTSMHIFPAETGNSPLLIPTRNRLDPQSAPYVLHSSPALDRAFAAALHYLDSAANHHGTSS